MFDITQARIPRQRHVWLIALVAPALTACMNLEAVIRVMPDGSGTVERNFRITSDLLMGFVEEQQGAEGFDLCESPDELAAMADRMGEGVEVVSSEPSDEGGRGCLTVFAFADINALRLNMDPETMMAGPLARMGEEVGMPGGGAADSGEEIPVRFEFEPGDPATLVIHLDQLWGELGTGEEAQDEEPSDTSPLEGMDSMERAMVKMMLEDARFALVIEVDGAIVDSDASFVDGSRVYLVDVDLERVAGNDADLERFLASEPDSPEELRELMEEVEGIRIETNEATTIRFRPSGF